MLEPYRVHVPEEDLADLSRRLASARWPEPLPGAGWAFGMDHDVLSAVVDHWAGEFDWRAHEAWLNHHPASLARVDGGAVHLLHARAPGGGGLALVLLHGWPSTVSEFRHVIGPLADPASHGGDAGDAFDVVAVSLPGFGWSGPTTSLGWDADRMAAAIAEALSALGVERYGVFGTDAGAYVATSLAAADPRAIGLHLHLGGVSITRDARASLGAGEELTDLERQALADLERYERTDSGYALVNGTKPHTVAFGLTDSPVGQAAWILEKFHTWTGADGTGGAAPFGAVALDDALAIVTTFWLTRTAGSAARFYAEAGATLARDGLPRVEVPTACALFPADIVVPSRRWAARSYPNIVRWTEMPRGGHFSALEVPDLLVGDLREFFRDLR